MSLLSPRSGPSLVDRSSRWLERRVSRRGFLVRSTFAATALAVVPKRYALEPGSAYQALCGAAGCGNPNCSCGSTCCSGFSTFCCTINKGYNFCPEGTFVGGWWAAADSSFCGNGTRYYLDCHATCKCTNGCGGYYSNGFTFCDTGCDGLSCNCEGGNCNNWVQGCYQFRYGQCNRGIGCSGRIECRMVSCTPPWQLDLNCDSTYMWDSGTAEMNAPCNTKVPTPPPTGPVCDSTATKCETVAIEAAYGGGGYFLATSYGKVLTYGTAQSHGDKAGSKLTHPIVAMCRAPKGGGYWLCGAGGSVFNFGVAKFWGSAVHEQLSAPIVGMAITPDGGGYWLAGKDGGVFSYGNAKFHGSLGGSKLASRVTGIESSATGAGYWLLQADGAVTPFGDALQHGNPKSQHPTHPVVSIERSNGGAGYFLVGSAGAVWAYGDATKDGTAYGKVTNWDAIGLAVSPGGRGYWVALADGAILSFGAAKYHGGGN